jgi:iron complex outermembrane receptor protein
MKTAICAVILFGVVCVGVPATLAEEGARTADLTELSLEELMNIEVTSVSKKEEGLFDAPAAVYVITQEDIRRSGATSIAEALRMVPGVQVARIDANKWAISARGFNSQFANKLLVLIDGRSVYTPAFAGVFWDVQDTLLEDIDRIEVIRGPGGTLWGANAVNGVINIITKNARDTQGGLVTATGGKEERGIGGARYGARLGDNLYVRAYGKYLNRDEFVTASGQPAADDWDVGRGGFRLDWAAVAQDAVTVQGDIYRGDVGQITTRNLLTPPFILATAERDTVAGGNLSGRWRHDFSARSNLSLQLYYDRTERSLVGAKEVRDTVDLDLQHRSQLTGWNEVVWGMGYRFTSDQVRNGFEFSFNPDRRGLSVASAFVQDEITAVPDQLRLILGSKLEHNDFTGFELQPSGRILWTLRPRHTLWAAVSRAVRTPSRNDRDVRFNLAVMPAPDGPPTVVSIFGNHDVKSETLLAYELGYRAEPLPRVFLDVAAFYNQYDGLRTEEPEAPSFEALPAPAHLLVPFRFADNMDGESYGVEVAASWNVASWCKLSGGYTWFDDRLRLDPGSRDPDTPAQAGNDPHHQFNTRVSLNLPARIELDAAIYYVDHLLYAYGPSRLRVPSYIRPDLRLAWHPSDRLEIGVVAQDLLDDHHLEFGAFLSPQAVAVQRAVFGQFRWYF